MSKVETNSGREREKLRFLGLHESWGVASFIFYFFFCRRRDGAMEGVHEENGTGEPRSP